MLRSLNEITRFQLQGVDEEIGRCKDLLFEDQHWIVRYMVADSNKWLPGGRKVLISPISLGEPDWEAHLFPINLSREEVKNSPLLDEHQPISLRYEMELFKYYGYGNYWMGSGLWGVYSYPAPLINAYVLEDKAQIKPEDRHLRSMEEVKGYGIQATDDKIGHIDDFILEDESWTICYVVIDTHNFFPGGRKALISYKSIEKVNWAERSIKVNFSAQKIKDSPLFDLELINDTEYEAQLNHYYGIS